jgi:hypothetical protein
VALPRLLHADRSFRLAGQARAKLAQLGRAAHHAVNKKAMHDGVERKRQIHKIADEVVRHAAAKAAMPACRIEPQQMVAVFVMFAEPQLADHTAIGKNFLHSRGLLLSKTLLIGVLPSGRVAPKTVPIPLDNTPCWVLPNFGKAKH